MDSRLDRYFRHTKAWQAEKQRLRAILLDYPLSEELKWRQPCYTYRGANVVILGGFKHTCDLGFFKGALLDNPHGLLENAIAVERAGLRVDFKQKDELVLVEELLAKMESDPEFRAAFEALTPGRQRGYNLFFGAAKQSKTRAARVEKHAARILEGKGIHDR